MKYILVAAATSERVIGKNNQLPWDIPEELADFRAFTQGRTIVMGRKTYEGLGRILPKRKNIMLTRNPASVRVGDFPVKQDTMDHWYVDGGEKGRIEIYTSKADLERHLDEEEILILGGAEIYSLFLDDPRSYIRLSEIHRLYDGDTFFPEFHHLYKEDSRESRNLYDIVWYSHR